MRAHPFRRSRLGAAAVALWLVASVGAHADIQNPGRSSFPGDRRLDNRTQPPPNAVPQTTSVLEGGTVNIVLRARGHSGEMADFTIRTPPAHGELTGEPRQLTLDTAQVTYLHHPGDNVGADSFTYAVQTRSSPLSADATVTVRIQEPPPVLAVSPAELDFGAVKSGETTRAELTLTNQGGGEAAGRLEPPPPWVVDGEASYRLPRGSSQTFALVFQPSRERAYVDALHFHYETGGGVRLVGTGLGGPGLPAGVGSAAGTLAPAPPAPGALPAGDAAAVSMTTATTLAAVAPPAASFPPPERSGPASLEPILPAGISSLPAAAVALPGDTDLPGVNAVAVRARGRSTLELTWRGLVPPPKSYRVEIRHLSLSPDDKLIVEWRPYALTEYDVARGFVTARLAGLETDSQECLRVVAVDGSGRLAAPSPLIVTSTLPASTWWRPTPLKVLGALLLLCGGLVWRQRWETRQILRSIDEARHASAV